eukprot:7391887-Prymnesium_polylepis.1
MFAVAHAMHDLLEVQNRTAIVGSELLETLIKRVVFEGATGLVDFYDASADGDRLYDGDRRAGVSYTLLNFVDSVQAYVRAGSWTPCAAAACGWSERWEPLAGVALTYSTADNTKPPQTAPPRVTEVRLGMLLPMFETEAAGYSAVSWSPRVGAYQALREINNKSDGVADHLLPSSQLRIAYRDSKCDATESLTATLHLTRDAFDGQGVSAVIGAGCSGATLLAAQVAGSSLVPIVSPTSSSPTLSDGKAYPYFARMIPSDAFGTVAMVDVLRTMWNYTSAALVHSTDGYGAGGASAFAEAASSAGLVISTTQRFAKDSVAFTSQQHALQQSGARVVVLYCQASDGSRFMRTALEAGVAGDGYLYLGGDTFVDSALWLSDAMLAADTSLRERALKGFFSVAANGQPLDSAVYQGYLARRQ